VGNGGENELCAAGGDPVHMPASTTRRSRTAITSRIVAALVVLALLGDGAAMAHAQLVHAEPEPGSVLPAAPTEAVLNFSEKLEPSFSSVVVRDALGIQVDLGDAYVDKYHAVMRVSLQLLAPGAYIVQWRAVSVSTHRTEGAFIFRVGE
jgi:methionine-rich copper-binding protein CopC